jgi:putative FmdB family regulatory protein
MLLFDFQCECGNKFEKLVPYGTETVSCTECDGMAKKLLSCPRIALDGTDPAYPTAWDKWEKKRKQKMAQEAKQAEE